MAVADDIEALVTRSPGLTEAEIAAALFGEAGYTAQVSVACRNLIKSRRIGGLAEAGATIHSATFRNER